MDILSTSNTAPPRVRTLATTDDIAAIELDGYDAFMPAASVPAALDASAAAFADRPALSYLLSADPADAPQVWTHREFAARRTQTANLLRELGVDETHAVSFLLPAIPEAYLTLFGGETAGIVCPINYLLNAEHIAELANAVNARVLVALAPCAELDLSAKVAHVRAACPALEHVLWVYPDGQRGPDSFLDRVEAQPSAALTFERAIDRATPAAFFHTGGTTGAPKLAQHTHGNQLHAAWSAAHFYASVEDDVCLNGFPLFHVAGSFVYGLSTLMSGGCVVLPTLMGMRNTAFVQRYWEFVEQLGATLLAGVPTVMSTLLGGDKQPTQPNKIRAMFTGGAPLPDGLAAQFEARFGVPVRNILGMTECAGVVSIEPFLAERVPGSCGLRLPFTEVAAIVPGSGEVRLVPAGETGVLALRGPNVSPGYSDPRYKAGTFEPGGWLVTGDIGHVDAQGRIFITGRAKDVIIRSSHNIDPGMIEEALLRHPDVAHAAAVGELDEYAGEVPVAFVTLRPGSSIDEAALLQASIPHIAERPAWPKRLTIIETMPITAIGKVYKPALRAIAIGRVMNERLAKAGLEEGVAVSVVEGPRGLKIEFTIGEVVGSASAGQRYDTIDAMMARVHVPYEIKPPR